MGNATRATTRRIDELFPALGLTGQSALNRSAVHACVRQALLAREIGGRRERGAPLAIPMSWLPAIKSSLRWTCGRGLLKCAPTGRRIRRTSGKRVPRGSSEKQCKKCAAKGGDAWLCASRAARISGPAAFSWHSEGGPSPWRRATLGSAARMGPAYFPTVLGALLAAIGLVMLLKSLGSAEGGNVERVNVWLLVRVLVAVAAFAVLLHPLGLVLTAVVVVVLAASAGHEFRVGEALSVRRCSPCSRMRCSCGASTRPCRSGPGS